MQSRPFTVWEHLEHQESKNRTKKSQSCWELGSSIRQEWENCPLPEVELKVEWILHSGKHGPIPTFWDVSLPSKLGRRSSRTPSIISLGARPRSGMHTSMQAVETTETMWHPFIHNTLCSPYLYRYAAWFYFFQCSFNLSEQCVYSVMPHIILC